MEGVTLSEERAQALEQLVKDGVAKSPTEALNEAVDTFLRQRQLIGLHIVRDPTYKTPDQWTELFNNLGKPMISAAGLYRAGKSAASEAFQELRDNFNPPLSSLVTSTRIIYSGNGLSGKIIHNYGGEVVMPYQANVSIIPVYRGMPLTKVLQSEEGVTYLRALFSTNDDPETIAGTLWRLSGTNIEQTVLWTPDQAERKRDSKRVVGFHYSGYTLNLNYDLCFGDVSGWHSGGVSVSLLSGCSKK